VAQHPLDLGGHRLYCVRFPQPREMDADAVIPVRGAEPQRVTQHASDLGGTQIASAPKEGLFLEPEYRLGHNP
jgi:hypothetical protein